jgi:hypothetical protein
MVLEDRKTTAAMKFFKFFAAAASASSNELPEFAEKRETKFNSAIAAIQSNPYRQPPPGQLESIEDVIAINDNPNEIRDQLM